MQVKVSDEADELKKKRIEKKKLTLLVLCWRQLHSNYPLHKPTQ